MLIGLGLVVLFILVAGSVVIYQVLKPRRHITYLSPEALDSKRQEIEMIRTEAINNALSQVDIDRANETCDELYKNYRVTRR
jgi:hypothetical protein